MISLSDEGRQRVALAAVAATVVSGVLTVGAIVLAAARGDLDDVPTWLLLLALVGLVGWKAAQAGRGDITPVTRILFGLVALVLVPLVLGMIQAVSGADSVRGYALGALLILPEAVLLATLAVLMLARVRA